MKPFASHEAKPRRVIQHFVSDWIFTWVDPVSQCAKLSHSKPDNGCLKYFKISILILNDNSQKKKEKRGKDFLKSYSADS